VKVHPLRTALPFPLDARIVESCLKAGDSGDAMFAEAFRSSLDAIPPAERRGALPGVTGHVAESVIEVILYELGYQPIWHFPGPGRHGVDLAMLSPGLDRVVVFEVKGTLRTGRLPRLSKRGLRQMSTAWIDNRENPGMVSLELESADVYGGVAVVQFAERTYRIGLTNDFEKLQPLTSPDQLIDLAWLDLVATETQEPSGCEH
jgi:hypothetical protein